MGRHEFVLSVMPNRWSTSSEVASCVRRADDDFAQLPIHRQLVLVKQTLEDLVQAGKVDFYNTNRRFKPCQS